MSVADDRIREGATEYVVSDEISPFHHDLIL